MCRVRTAVIRLNTAKQWRGALWQIITQKVPPGDVSYLCGLQVLPVLHPPIGGLGLPSRLALPHQRVVDGLLDVLGFLNEMRLSCEMKNVCVGVTLQRKPIDVQNHYI